MWRSGGNGDCKVTEGEYHIDKVGLPVRQFWSSCKHEDTILTRNQDLQRQKRMQELCHQQGGAMMPTNPRTVVLQKSTTTSSPYSSPRSSPWSSHKLPHIYMAKKNAPPAPPPKASIPEKKSPSRMIAEVIKQQEGTSMKQHQGLTKSKPNKGKKGAAKQTETDSILKELKNTLRPINDSEFPRPSTPQRCAHDELMGTIRGSNIQNLRRVNIAKNRDLQTCSWSATVSQTSVPAPLQYTCL